MRDHAFDELVLAIYRAAEEPSAWVDCLERIRTALNGTGITLMHHDAVVGQRNITTNAGYDEGILARYHGYYHQIDPWGQALPNVDLSAGCVINGCEMVSPAEVTRGEYYADFGRHIGSAQSMFGAIEADAKRTTFVVVARAIDQHLFDAADLALLERLMPHLRQAFRLHRRITGSDGMRRTSCEALDRLPLGVVLLDRQGRPVFVNAAARRLTARGDGLIVERDRVRAADAADAARLALAIARAVGPVTTTSTSDGESAFVITRKATGTTLRTVVLPVGRQEDAIGFEVGAAAAIFIGDPDQRVVDDPSRLIGLFGLTATEARIAAHLANGETLTDIAPLLGLRVSTVRWYAKQILQKAGVSTQSQFVSLVLRGPAAVRGHGRLDR